MKYISERDARRLFDDLLDEQGPIMIGTLRYDPSYVLKNVDEVAYRCGLNDWLDANDLTPDEDEADEESDE